MARILSAALVVGLGILVLFGTNGVQAGPAQGTPGSLIYVPVTVTDNKNAPVATLKQENFQILEDNKEQKIAYFSAAGEPVSVSIVLGLSARGPVQSPGQKDRVTVDIVRAVERVREAGGTAAVFEQVPLDADTLLNVVGNKVEAMRKDANPRKALVIVGDGLISSGIQGSNVRQPTALVNAAKALPFPVHFLVVSTSMQAPAFQEGGNYTTGFYLEQIADFSGGRLISGQVDNTLDRAATELRDSLKNQYVLGYASHNTAQDGKWRKITVKVTAPAGAPKMKIAAKERYMVPKP